MDDDRQQHLRQAEPAADRSALERQHHEPQHQHRQDRAKRHPADPPPEPCGEPRLEQRVDDAPHSAPERPGEALRDAKGRDRGHVPGREGNGARGVEDRDQAALEGQHGEEAGNEADHETGWGHRQLPFRLRSGPPGAARGRLADTALSLSQAVVNLQDPWRRDPAYNATTLRSEALRSQTVPHASARL
jgi:hypothetical protein